MKAVPTGTGPGEHWPAPLAPGPLNATVDVPGSKSLTNRFLVMAALADTPVTISGGLHSRDSALMMDALRSLGVAIEASGRTWTITGGPLRGGGHIDCGLAGTVMRFVPPLVLLADAPVTFDGDPEARVRPMGPLLEALRALGADVDDGGTGALPFSVSPGDSLPTEVMVDASASSQFVTGLLLVAPRLEHGLTIRHVGATLPSLPHIDMTCEALRGAGVQVDQPDQRTWVVYPGPVHLPHVDIEPDLSNAGPFMAAAVVASGHVRIPRWPAVTTQPGALLPGLLERMGASCTHESGSLVVTGTGEIRGIDADLSAAGEITPTLAALCALADGPSVLRGIGHLRGHETDRLAAIEAEVRRLGGECEATADSLRFGGMPSEGLRGCPLESYHDHRMATFGAIIGLRVPGTSVINVGTTAKTMPQFPQMWADMVGGAH